MCRGRCRLRKRRGVAVIAQDALKWLRRAAEAASEAEADDRALELAKAAAEIATNLEESAKHPAPVSIPISMTDAPSGNTATEVPSGSAAPASAPSAPMMPLTSPRVRSAARARQSSSENRRPPPKAAPQKPKAPAAAQTAQNKAIPKAAGSGPSAPRAPAKLILAPPSETSDADVHSRATDSTGQLPRVKDNGDPDDTLFRPRPGAAKVDLEEAGPATPRSKRNTQNPTAPVDSSDDMEAWPTQSLSGGELPSFDGGGGDKTRVGVSAYREPADPSVRQPIALRGIKTSQAVRVVVWRGPRRRARCAARNDRDRDLRRRDAGRAGSERRPLGVAGEQVKLPETPVFLGDCSLRTGVS